MRVAARCGVLWVVVAVVAGCGIGGGAIRARSGNPLSPRQLQSIQPGHTTFSEVLQRLGPPDYIIDGRQEIPDPDWSSVQTGETVPTRTITAPAGQVILLYLVDFDTRYSRLMGTIGPVQLQQARWAIRPSEFFVFVSKQDRRVVDLVSGASGG